METYWGQAMSNNSVCMNVDGSEAAIEKTEDPKVTLLIPARGERIA